MNVTRRCSRARRRVAERFVVAAEHAIADRARFVVALSGGSTPRRTFELLARERSVIPRGLVARTRRVGRRAMRAAHQMRRATIAWRASRCWITCRCRRRMSIACTAKTIPNARPHPTKSTLRILFRTFEWPSLGRAREKHRSRTARPRRQRTYRVDLSGKRDRGRTRALGVGGIRGGRINVANHNDRPTPERRDRDSFPRVGRHQGERPQASTRRTTPSARAARAVDFANARSHRMVGGPRRSCGSRDDRHEHQPPRRTSSTRSIAARCFQVDHRLLSGDS